MYLPLIKLPSKTVLWSLFNYVTNQKQRNLKWMKKNIGLMPILPIKFTTKTEKNLAIYHRVIEKLKETIKKH